MELSDEDRARIDEEELYRAEARVRAEAKARRQLEAEASEREEVPDLGLEKESPRRGIGGLLWIAGAALVLFLIPSLDSSWKSPVHTVKGRAPNPAAVAPVLTPEEQSAADKKAAEDAQRAAAATEKHRQQLMNLTWWYSDTADPMGRGNIRTAYVKSQNEFSFDFPYQKNQRAELTLRVRPERGNDVMLSIEKGQFLCGVGGCSVSVVFGDGKPMKFDASGPDDHSSETLFLDDYDQFLSNLRKVERVRIEAKFFQQGVRVFEFNVGGLNWK